MRDTCLLEAMPGASHLSLEPTLFLFSVASFYLLWSKLLLLMDLILVPFFFSFSYLSSLIISFRFLLGFSLLQWMLVASCCDLRAVRRARSHLSATFFPFLLNWNRIIVWLIWNPSVVFQFWLLQRCSLILDTVTASVYRWIRLCFVWVRHCQSHSSLKLHWIEWWWLMLLNYCFVFNIGRGKFPSGSRRAVPVSVWVAPWPWRWSR